MKLYYKIKNKIKRYITRPVTPPTYEVKRATIKHYKEKYGINVLVETGTFFGETIDFFKESFQTLYSIELAEDLAEQAKKLFENDKNVTIIQGDSGKILKQLVPQIKEPALFWLDGHYSSEFFIGDKFIKTARTDVDTPVVDELRAILVSGLDHVILIDDAREFTGVGDYPSIGKLKKIIRSSGRYTLSVDNDIIRIIPKS